MRPEEVLQLPARPPSEVEWEELLIRLEIVPRVVRNTLEERATEGAVEPLRELVRAEARVGRWLEALAAGTPPPPLDAPAEVPEGGVESLSLRFASLRARTFAMLQRRGLEVWSWAGEVDGARRATVYQVLARLAAHDTERLAALRQAVRC